MGAGDQAVGDVDREGRDGSKADGREEVVRDLIAVIVLSTTAVLTAWCGFEASKWGGEMSIALNQASSARVQASDYIDKARDARQLDVTLYAAWVEANAKKDGELASYVAERFTDGFATAFDAWVSEGRPEASPFAREDYVPVGSTEALEWTARADSKFEEGVRHNERSDNYSFLTVHFALVLFLIAVSKGKISALTSRILLVLGSVVGVIGLLLMLMLPVVL